MMKNVPVPNEVKSNPAALSEWNELIADLTEEGLLDKIDRHSLKLYCLLWADYLALRATIAKDGSTVKDKKGSTKRHPALMRLSACEARLVALMPLCLLAAKSRLKLREAEHSDLTPAEITLGEENE